MQAIQPLAMGRWVCTTSHGKSRHSPTYVRSRRSSGALVGATDHGTTKALYAKDPDGLEFEVCWLVPEQLLTPEVTEAKTRMRALDIESDIERYGLETVGGL